ncbi:helix-turn-helix domain-containing protein [Paenibacillus sp. P25]|nr:helix-turn-helix domain-containing protein [Paenibacillus sp. P25]
MGKNLVGNHIRKLRFNHNEMTQQQLADKVGVTRQTIVALEKGNYSPLWSWLFALLTPSTYLWKRCSFTGINQRSKNCDYLVLTINL